MSMRSSLRLIVALGLCSMWAWAQDAAPKTTPAAPAKPKAKKVYTEEDLGKLRGGISVVGEPAKPKTAPAVSLEDVEDAEVPEEGADRPPSAKKRVTPANCRSAAWAKIVDTSVIQQGLGMADGFWHQRLFGNSFCMDNVGSLDKIAQSIQGEYTMDTGDRFQVTTQVYRPWPLAEALVPATKKGDLLIVVMRGQPYLLEGLDTIEEVIKGRDAFGKETQSHFRWIIKRFRLRDPDSGNIAFFENGKDKDADVQGSFFIVVTRR